MSPSPSVSLNCICFHDSRIALCVIPGAFSGFVYLALTVQVSGRFYPVQIYIPFETQNVFHRYPNSQPNAQGFVADKNHAVC